MKGFFLGLILSVTLILFQFNNVSGEIIGDGGDNYEYFSFQHLVKENVVNSRHPLARTNVLRYPVGFDLASGYDGVFSVFTGAFLGMIVPQPIAYNTTIILILTFNFFLTYWSIKKISGSESGAIIGGLFYGLSPYVFGRINSHLNLAFIGGFPLLVYACFNLHKKSQQGFVALKDMILFYLAILLIAFGSLQYLIMLFWSLVILIIISIVFRLGILEKSGFVIKKILKENTDSFAISTILFTLIFLFFYDSYIDSIFSGKLALVDKYSGYIRYHLPSLSDIFVPNQYLGNFWAKINHSKSSIEKVISVGFSGWIIFLLLFARERSKKIKFLLLTALGLLVLFSLSIIRIPLLPEGGRWTIIFSLLIVVIICKKRIFKNKYLFASLFFLLVIERFTFSIYSSPLFPKKEADIIRKLPGEAVLNIPLSKYNSKRSAYPYSFNKKIVDGYFHYTADTLDSNEFLKHKLISKAICDSEKLRIDTLNFTQTDYKDTIRLLKEKKINTIILHKNTVTDKYYFDKCSNVRYWWNNLNPKTLVINTNTSEVKVNTLRVPGPQPKAKIFFQKGGKFVLRGLLVYPAKLTDTHLLYNNAETNVTDWKENKSGIATTSDPVVSISVESGDSVYIKSEKETGEDAYFTLYYQFELDPASSIVRLPIEMIYEGKDYNIYTIN